MANNRVRTMSDVTDDNSKNQQESGEESELESSNETGGGESTDKAQYPQRSKLYGSAHCGCFCDTRSNDKKLLPSALDNSCLHSCPRFWTAGIFFLSQIP